MDLTTTQDVLEHWRKHESEAARNRRREMESLRRDIEKAQAFLADATARYRKEKLRARSKAKANSDDVFRELEDYSDREDIRNAYGWEFISEAEMDRLMHLWDMREASRTAGPYTDRVVEMLEAAREHIFAAFGEPLLEYDRELAEQRRAAQQIARENLNRMLQRQEIP